MKLCYHANAELAPDCLRSPILISKIALAWNGACEGSHGVSCVELQYIASNTLAALA
jgi:hypothetical protein